MACYTLKLAYIYIFANVHSVRRMLLSQLIMIIQNVSSYVVWLACQCLNSRKQFCRRHCMFY